MKRAFLLIALLLVFSSQGLATTYTVANCADSGTGSLRQAITDANAGATGSIIFNITTTEAQYSTGEAYPGLVTTEAGSNTWFRIIVNTALPVVTQGNLYIHGSTQTFEATNTAGPKVEVRMNGTADIFTAISGSSVTVEGLALNRTGGVNGGKAIALSGSNCQILGCYIGVSATGEVASSTKNDYGINIYGSASNNKIGNGTTAGGNIISGNAACGIYFNGSSCVSNQILGNYIGTNAGGTTAIGNGYGIWMASTATSNKIGDGTDGGKNVISGNTSYGIYIYGSDACSNEVLGNYIGTTATGEAALGNATGINLSNGSSSNIIGGDSTYEANLISGNTNYGIQFDGSVSSPLNNTVKGNYIGVNAALSAKLPNNYGIYASNCGANFIGDTNFKGNHIAGNTQYGIYLTGCSNFKIIQNAIGSTFPNFPSDLGNGNSGIYLNNCTGVIIGGDNGSMEGNAIVGNKTAGAGIYINGGSSNMVKGSFIGVAPPVAGPAVGLGNKVGIIINNSSGNTIGSLSTSGWNAIASSETDGIQILSSSANNIICGNTIGLSLDQFGEHSFPNVNGIIIQSSQSNRIGTTDAVALGSSGNVISNNVNYGINIDSASTSNEVWGNLIGTSSSGEAAAGNGDSGIRIDGSCNVIGGATPGKRNIISGNIHNTGILFFGSGATNNNILGNYIGATASGGAALPNYFGIWAGSGASFNKIGDGTAGGKNIISGNANNGIHLTDSGTNSNEVIGNYIGTDINGTSALTNEVDGVRIEGGAKYNKIGNGLSGGGNVISGNKNYGIQIAGSGTNQNEILGNYIGVNAAGDSIVENNWSGVFIYNAASYNKIGNATTLGRNLISGNKEYGIYISGGGLSTQYNEILGNFIGTNASGNASLANTKHGILLGAMAQNTRIGNGTSDGRNIISGNTWNGIQMTNADTYNSVLGNYIGTRPDGITVLPNGWHGVEISSGAENIVGDGTPGGRNIISGNAYHGVVLGYATRNNDINGNYIGLASDGQTNAKNTGYGVFVDYVHGAFLGAYQDRIRSNVIAYNGNSSYPAGVYVDGANSSGETISMNSMYSNYEKGIKLVNNANRGIATPEITSTSYSQLTGLLQVTGTATPGARVEIFKAQGNQGKAYLGYVTANGSGTINGSLTYLGLVSGDVITATQTDAPGDTSEFCLTREVTISTTFMYQPDLIIGTLESGADYVGEGIFENTPVTQVKTSSVVTNETAVCYIKVKNAGNMLDTILLTGEGSSTGFTVKYFGSKTGTDETTPSMTGSGARLPLGAGVSGEGRVEITYSGITTATKELIITAVSSIDGTKKDVIKAIAVFNSATPTQPATREYTESQLGIPGMHITIPSGASTVDVTVTASIITTPPGDPPVGFSIGGKIISIQANVTQFAIPVTVTIPIDGPLAEPRVYYWDGTKWSTTGIVIVSYTNTSLTFTTTHFTIFAPMGAAANNRVRFGPNPYNPNNGSGRFWYWLDASKDTSIYLIDLSGTVVYKKAYSSGINGAQAGENNVEYDGKTSWGDVLGNGAYIYRIVQDSKSVGGGKIAVIK